MYARTCAYIFFVYAYFVLYLQRLLCYGLFFAWSSNCTFFLLIFVKSIVIFRKFCIFAVDFGLRKWETFCIREKKKLSKTGD